MLHLWNRFKHVLLQGIALLLLIWSRSTLAGDYAADMLNIGVGARSLAMGGAYTAMANEASMAYWNPAGMAMEKRIGVQFEHVPMFSGLAQYNTAAVVFSLTPDMAIGLSWIRLGVDDIPRYGALQGSRYDRLVKNINRSTGQSDGTFGDQENAVLLSFCRGMIFDLQVGDPFSPIVLPIQLSFGVTGKYFNQRLDTATGTGQGLDAGALLRLVANEFIQGDPTRWIGVGVAVHNLSKTSIVWDTASRHKDEVARTMQCGVAASYRLSRLRTRVTLSFDRELLDVQESFYGGEVRFFDRLALRGGYSREHFSAGAGLYVMGLYLDYAFLTGELDNTHRISAAYGF
jgi:hypothetical protein